MNGHELFVAAESGDVFAVGTLLAGGADVNAARPNGETALMRAASNGRLDAVKFLLDAGADVNAQRADGMTPLIYAAFFGHTDVVQLLIDSGADLNATDQVGMTALDWAKSKGVTDSAAALMRAAAPEGRPPATRGAGGGGRRSEEILDLQEISSEATPVDSTAGLLDLPAEWGAQEGAPDPHLRQPGVNPIPAEPAVPSWAGAPDREVGDHDDAPASASAVTSNEDRGERRPHPLGIPGDTAHRVDKSTPPLVTHRASAQEESRVELRPPSSSGTGTEDRAVLGATEGDYSPSRLPPWFKSACLSLSIMIGAAALTVIIFYWVGGQPEGPGQEAVPAPLRAETPQAPPAKSGDDAVLTAELNGWLEATRARDVEKQMGFYAPSLHYYRKRNVPNGVVRADKDEVIGRARRVDISVGEPEIRYNKNTPTASMRFRKVYLIESETGSRSGEVIQELIWRKTKDGWKIISERDVKVVR